MPSSLYVLQITVGETHPASNDDVVLRDQIRALKAQQLSIKEEKMKHEKMYSIL